MFTSLVSRGRFALFLTGWLACFSPAPKIMAADSPRLVGVARTDITPDYAVRLSGYGMRRTESEGIEQHIWAKALAIGSDADGPAVLVTVDNCGVPESIRTEILKRLAGKTKVVSDRFAIGSSHTHSAPMLRGVLPNLYSMDIPAEHQVNIDRYTREFTDRLEQVVLAALADRKPARLSWAQGAVGFAKNRRGRPLAPSDHALPALRVTGPDGQLRAVLTSYACHCTTLALNKIHGDWAGSAQEIIERENPGVLALTAIGCGADQNPEPRGTYELTTQHGQALATEVRRLLAGAWQPLTAPLNCATKRIDLPFDTLPARAEWEQLATNKAAQIAYHATKMLARLDRGETLPTKLPYLVQSWSFGDELAMVFLPGEVVVDYSLRIKREFDAARLWVNGYANDVPCYIPSKRILTEGGYEGGAAMVYYDRPTRFAPDVEELIIRAVHEVVPKQFLAPPRKAMSPPPKSPAESRAAIQTKPGLVVELVAAEPLIVDPVAIDFGTDGKLWVVEMHDYPAGLDGNWQPGGRVKVLTSSKGDGHYDQAVTFIEGLPFPTGVMPWRKGALICAAPDILYAEDTDGDGRADVVKKIFTGFYTDNYQARVNSLSLGLDNWVHGANGLLGGVIHGLAGGREVDIRGRDFRMNPDTLVFEPVSGLTQQGRARDDWGNWFGCNNSVLAFHFPLPDHYLRRNPHVAAPAPNVSLPAGADPNRLFPISTPLERFNHPESLNRTTSACGLGVYRDALLGPEFSENLFTCEPVHNLVRRLQLTPRSVTFTANQPADEQAGEFLASTDNWFRPVQAVTGPDGALWVVDMYRFVIEHPRWIPLERLAELDVRAGDDKGRIYRIYPRGATLRPVRDLTRLSAAEVAATLDSPNGVQRDLAHRELFQRQDKAALAPLAAVFAQSTRPAARLQALCALDGQQAVTPALLVQACADTHPAVRRHAIRLSESILSKSPEVAAAVLKLADDPDVGVRYQLAFSLGEWNDARATTALVQLARTGAGDAWLRTSVLSSAAGRTAELLRAMLATPAKTAGRSELVNQLIATAGGTASPAQLAEMLPALAPVAGKPPEAGQLTVLASFQDVLEQRQIPWSTFTGSANSTIRSAAMRIKAAYLNARQTAQDAAVPAPARRAALSLLGRGFNDAESDAPWLAGFLTGEANVALRPAALDALKRTRSSQVPGLLLAQWPQHPPALRAGLVDLLLGREEWTRPLLAALEKGVVAPPEISVPNRQRLLNHAHADIKSLATRLLPGTGAERAAVLARYQTVAALRGAVAKGAEVFAQNCANCHALRGAGQALGPDLAAFRDKPVGDFLVAILDPSAAIEPRFIAYQIETRDDRSLTGVILAETATSLTLGQAGGAKEILLRSNLKEIRASRLSLMPEGFENTITPQQMADLIAWLKE